jgi:hypothetical protein
MAHLIFWVIVILIVFGVVGVVRRFRRNPR